MRVGTKTIEERFWPKVAKKTDDECWDWIGARQRTGYGRILSSSTRKTDGAHRVSWELHYGPVPTGLCVCHHCDNPPCVNPVHLFLGTRKDNTQDMMRKGRDGHGDGKHDGHRGLQGEEHRNAILTEEDVRLIRAVYASGQFTQAALAKQFGVGEPAIFKVISRRSWRHIP